MITVGPPPCLPRLSCCPDTYTRGWGQRSEVNHRIHLLVFEYCISYWLVTLWSVWLAKNTPISTISELRFQVLGPTLASFFPPLFCKCGLWGLNSHSHSLAYRERNLCLSHLSVQSVSVQHPAQVRCLASCLTLAFTLLYGL